MAYMCHPRPVQEHQGGARMSVPDVLLQPRCLARGASGETRLRTRAGKMHGIGREKRKEGAAREGAGSGAEMRRGTGDGMAS